MNKKDRIAVVVSVAYFLVCLPALLDKIGGGLILYSPVVFYWGYRFIQNDISFLKVKDD